MIKYLTIVLALATATANGQTLDASRLTGRWAGEGVFFKSALAEQLGPLPIRLEFSEGRLVSGEVGRAQAGPAKVSSGRRMLQLTSKLKGRIGPAPALDKDTFVLLITALTDSTATAEFHLKTNALFDSRVREGRLSLRRTAR